MVLKVKEWDEVAILIDFDGTITTIDTNDQLLYKHMNNKIKELLAKEQEMNYVKFMNALLDEVNITEEEYLKFILSEIDISQGFVQFYENIKSRSIPVEIVSGGFYNGIIPFLNKYGITDVNVHANTLNFNDKNITITYHDGNNFQCCDMGPCGNCKIQHYDNLRDKGYKIIFIGDGMSDQALAKHAEIVFAKDELEQYCIDNDIEYIPWNDFRDINKIMFSDNQLII